MDPIRTTVVVVLVPGAVALALALAGRRWKLAGAVAFAAGAIAGVVGLIGWPSAWPLAVSDRFGHVVAVGALGSIASASATARWRWPIATATGLLVALAVVGPLLEHRFAGWRGIVLIAGSAAVIAVLSRAIDSLGERQDRGVLLLVLIALAAASVASGLSGSLALALLGGATTAALGGVWLVTVRDHRNFATAMGPVLASTLYTSLALGTLYSSTLSSSAAALLAVPVAIAIAARFAPRRFFVSALAAVLVLVALALAPPILAGDAATSDTSDDDYGYE